jgi:hypothetical protein
MSLQFMPITEVEYQVILKNGSIYFVSFTQENALSQEEKDLYSKYMAFEGYDNDKNRFILYTNCSKMIIQTNTNDYYGREKKTHIVRSMLERQ